MALPTVADCKTYLRVQGTAEDALLGSLLARATAAVRGAVRLPIVAAPRTVHLVAEGHTVHGQRSVLYLPGPFNVADPVPTVVDRDGNAVVADKYALDGRLGTITVVSPYRFGLGLHVVTAAIGWSAHPEYSELLEPILASAVVDTVADLYQRRNPAAQSEGAGGGVYTQWASTQGVPPRVWETLEPFRPWRVR